MVRLLRRVLRLGVLAGVGVGIVKVVKGRKGPDPWADSWVSTGAPGATRPSPAPVAAAPKPPAPTGKAQQASAASPAPTTAGEGEAGSAEGETGTAAESDSGDPDAGEAHRAGGTERADKPGGKAPAGRVAKPTRTGPARRSPTGKATEPPGERLWVAASDGVCPQTHPVKAKLASKIFHTPGSRNYSRTKADRCYPDEESAQADGLRPALR